MLPHKKLPGFTLVELSIVLVIIGLIVGGVLAGQALIHSAQMRAQVSQLDQISAAVNTFYTQFEALPGDYSNNPPVAGYLSRTQVAGDGDGNGAVESICDPGKGSESCGEVNIFWSDLSIAGLFNFTSSYDNSGAACVAVTAAELTTYLPKASYGHGTRLSAYGQAGYWSLAMLIGSFTSSDEFGYYDKFAGIAPLDAYFLDTKLDDGIPLTGTFQSFGPFGVVDTPATCINESPDIPGYQTTISTYECLAINIYQQ